MMQHTAPGRDSAFGPEDMVNASELREFVFCERSWFLARQGFAVSREAQAQRASGVAFHEARAAATSKGISQNALWWAVILALAALALLLLKALLGGSR